VRNFKRTAINRFYNLDILPVIYTQGSLEQADLAPLAHLSLTIIGRR
jgi:histidine ammonia-lyase